MADEECKVQNLWNI
jgi:hypothetical protein